jgi:hypothetical protein
VEVTLGLDRGHLALVLIISILLSTTPATVYAAGFDLDYVAYVTSAGIENTSVEIIVVDEDTGEPVSNAIVSGEIHSRIVSLNLKTDRSGKASRLLTEFGQMPKGEVHEYELTVSAPGYENKLVRGQVRVGENNSVVVMLKYKPFELIMPSSGSISRGWLPSSYSYVSSEQLGKVDEEVKHLGLSAEDNAIRAAYEEAGCQIEERYRTELDVKKVFLGYEPYDRPGVSELDLQIKRYYEANGYRVTELKGVVDWKYVTRTYSYDMARVYSSAGYRVDGGVQQVYHPGEWVYSGKWTREASYSEFLGWQTGEEYIEGYRFNGFKWAETYQEYIPGYWETYQSYEKIGIESYQEWVPGRWELRTATQSYWSYEIVGGHWEYRQVGGHWEYVITGGHWEWYYYSGWYWVNDYGWVWVNDHAWVWVYDYGWVQRTTQISYWEWVPSYYVTKTRDVYGWVTKQRWVEGHYETRTRYYVGREIYEWKHGWVEMREYWDVYLPISGVVGYSVERPVYREEVHPLQMLEGFDIRVPVYGSRHTRYEITDYYLGGWVQRRETLLVSPLNGYSGEVSIMVESDDGIDANISSSKLNFNSPSRAELILSPKQWREGSSVVRVTARDSNGRVVKTVEYRLDLLTLPKPERSVSSSSWVETWKLEPSAQVAQTSVQTKAMLTVQTTPVSGEVFVNGASWGMAPQTRSLDSGSYMVSFGNVEGYVTPLPQTVSLAPKESRTVVGVYERASAPQSVSSRYVPGARYFFTTSLAHDPMSAFAVLPGYARVFTGLAYMAHFIDPQYGIFDWQVVLVDTNEKLLVGKDQISWFGNYREAELAAFIAGSYPRD